MTVYEIKPTRSYTYGNALVAADNEEQAIETFRNANEYNDYEYDDYQCECKLIEKLHYYCETPTIITNHIGAE